MDVSGNGLSVIKTRGEYLMHPNEGLEERTTTLYEAESLAYRSDVVAPEIFVSFFCH